VPVKPLSCPDSAQVKESLYAFKRRHTLDEGIQLGLPKKNTVKVDTLVINNIQFEFNSFKLRDTAILQEFEPFFAKSDVTRIQVTGFTDNTGSEEYNLELSRRRAFEIAALLKAMYHIPDTMIEAEGKGISNDFRDKGKNRRVEVYLYHK
jgi:outer membrane protein OmpA-like peptidoglycan-associated protein